MRVVATAGHVDHGKSTLVRALTGTDPDRFVEEKKRGLTIDLGFAWCELPSGTEVAFVDVPGHVRFIRNMLAGVGGGGAPGVNLRSAAVSLPAEYADPLRTNRPAVLGRTHAGRCLLDLYAVPVEEDEGLLDAVRALRP